MAVYLAVDADGTKTECVVGDQERILSRATGPAISIRGVNAEAVGGDFLQVLERAGSLAGVPLYLITRSCISLPEVSDGNVRRWAKDLLKDVLTGELLLLDQEEIALEAAFGARAGVLAYASDRSYVIGRCTNGSRFHAGGWGPRLGDEGAAHWIGSEAIRSGLRALDRGVPSCVLREIFAQWRTPSVAALLAKARSCTYEDLGLLADAVDRCALQGDALATAVLERAGEELATQINVVCSKVLAAGCQAEDTRRVAYAGSVLTTIPKVREAMAARLRSLQPSLLVDEQPTHLVEGALAKARRG